LQLLAVVRGLEALEQPSRVTLITHSRYVDRGIRNGIAVWRHNDWQWERFGEFAPVKNRDLWKRVDRAMRFHKVHCRVWGLKRTAESNSAVDATSGIVASRESRALQVAGRLVRKAVEPITAAFHKQIALAGSTSAFGCA
jgi:ribonuclease HI